MPSIFGTRLSCGGASLDSELRRSEMLPGDTGLLLRLQTEVLEAVACGEALVAVADMLCRRAEAMAPGALCWTLTVDAEGCLHPLAAPSLPLAFASAIDGL